MIWQARLSDMGLGLGDSWPNILFSEFISLEVFGLIFLSLITLGSLNAALLKSGVAWLNATVLHVELRLAQYASTIISFTAGLALIAALHSAFTFTGQGALFLLGLVVFDVFLAGLFLVAGVFARRARPFHLLRVSVPVMLLSLVMIGVLLVWGGV